MNLRAAIRQLIYLPSERVTPIDRALPEGEEVTVTTSDGFDLAAWWLSAGDGAAVLSLPGNGGERSGRAPFALALAKRGLACLLVEYRGFGGNPGQPTEEGLLRDARAARAHLHSRPEVDPARVVYFGESLGAAVAVALASEVPPAALVLRSPFASLLDAARHHYGWVPAWLLPDRFDVAGRVGDVAGPVLVAAGEADSIVPLGHSRRVYEAATGPKRFVTIPGADHNDDVLFVGDELLDAVAAFLADHSVLGGT